ncbi:hypothetical protein ACOMHN_028648 [Nucella lapillus]
MNIDNVGAAEWNNGTLTATVGWETVQSGGMLNVHHRAVYLEWSDVKRPCNIERTVVCLKSRASTLSRPLAVRPKAARFVCTPSSACRLVCRLSTVPPSCLSRGVTLLVLRCAVRPPLSLSRGPRLSLPSSLPGAGFNPLQPLSSVGGPPVPVVNSHVPSLIAFAALPVSMVVITQVLSILPLGGSQDVVLFLCFLISLTPLPASLEAFRMEHVLSHHSYAHGINRRGPEGITPLMLVTSRPQIARLLLASKADPELADNQGMTFLGRVLSLKPWHGLTVPVVRELLSICLSQAVPFRLWAHHTPSDDPHNTRQLVDPTLRNDPFVLRVLKETCFLRSGSVSLTSLARHAVIRRLDSVPGSRLHALRELGRVRETADGDLTADVTSSMLHFLHYEDLGVRSKC